MSDRRDEGTVLLLTIGLTLVLLLLVGVVVDSSAVFLARRELASAADGAAVAAAQSLDEQALYEGGLGEQVPLSPEQVEQAVRTYAGQEAVAEPGLRMSGSVSAGRTATVTAARVVRLPFAGRLGMREVDLSASATARAPVTPAG